jgi:5-methylcytosine-specific restriction endonuclease McrA
MLLYQQNDPSMESQWRAIILFGKNVQSYKFAFAHSLLELASKEKTFITLEELAEPFSRHTIEHIRKNDKQGTSPSSPFLDACRDHIEDKIDYNELIVQTEKHGFNAVIDRFPNVGGAPVPVKFYEKDYTKKRKGLVITDDLIKLKESIQFNNFDSEIEARWDLVETAWNLNLPSNLLNVNYDDDGEIFFTQNDRMRRVNVTSARDSLNGYQKGKCFYCFKDIILLEGAGDIAHVDHFFPHKNKLQHQANINGVWNLVLACQECNSGTDGKFVKIPDVKYLERLTKRNAFFIDSHHPLRETLINQTGKSPEKRRKFLQEQNKIAIENSIQYGWKPKNEHEATF